MTVHPAGGAPGSKHWGGFKATSILPAVMEQAAAHPTPPAEGGHRGWLGAEGTSVNRPTYECFLSVCPVPALFLETAVITLPG